MLKVEGKKIHFVGIGGIGMSAIAQIAAERGAVVDGCDVKSGGSFRTLQERGYHCEVGHSADHVKGADVVVHSAAVPLDCPELMRARDMNIPVLPRSHMLAHLMQDHKSISVVGSHGKTTTTWLTSHVLIENGFDPTVMLGGNVSSMDGNFRRGRSEWFVSEIDESDGLPKGVSSFLTILTNIDKEHMNWYGSMEKIEDEFSRFLSATCPEGAVVVCADDERALEVASSTGKKLVTYGMTGSPDIEAKKVEFDDERASFNVIDHGEGLGRFSSGLPGNHNVRNSLAAIGVARQMGISVKDLRKALAICPRVERRLHVREVGKAVVVDDYGHHPTEIKATLETLRLTYAGKILCVFQPHRYTRTKELAEEFAACFGDVDMLYILPIYAANEPPIPGVSSEALAESVRKNSSVDVCTAAKEDILDLIGERIGDYSVMMFLGAGDIVGIADELVERFGV